MNIFKPFKVLVDGALNSMILYGMLDWQIVKSDCCLQLINVWSYLKKRDKHFFCIVLSGSNKMVVLYVTSFPGSLFFQFVILHLYIASHVNFFFLT